MVTDNLASLCEQQLVDCVTVDSACNGELTDNAVTVMPQRRALARCRIAPWIVQGSVTRYKDVPTHSEQASNVDNGTAIRAHHS